MDFITSWKPIDSFFISDIDDSGHLDSSYPEFLLIWMRLSEKNFRSPWICRWTKTFAIAFNLKGTFDHVNPWPRRNCVFWLCKHLRSNSWMDLYFSIFFFFFLSRRWECGRARRTPKSNRGPDVGREEFNGTRVEFNHGDNDSMLDPASLKGVLASGVPT